MARVIGIGGIFQRAANSTTLRDWYATHLGIHLTEWGGATFDAAPDAPATNWAIFDRDTDYFGDPHQAYMITFRVDDLATLHANLRGAGMTVSDTIDDTPHGRFAWVVDPEGTRIELWQPTP